METKDFIYRDERNTLLTPLDGPQEPLPWARNNENNNNNKEDDQPPQNAVARFFKRERDDIISLAFWRGCVAEFLGVLLLCVFTIGLGEAPPGGTPPPLLHIALGVGFFIFVILTALANVSGAHVNPAVSLGFMILGQCTVLRGLVYMVFQVAGAVTGCLLLRLMLLEGMGEGLGLFVPPAGASTLQVLAGEGTIGFLLVFVVSAALDPRRTDVAGSIPHAVGLTVAVNILFAGNLSGGCMNPARATGPAVATGTYQDLWMYWAGPMSGGLAAPILYQLLFRARKPATAAAAPKSNTSSNC